MIISNIYNTNQAWWEKAYQTAQYLNLWDFKHPSPELVSLIATGLIPEKGNCLDAGCGSGNEAIFLTQCGYNVTGIDFSEKALEIADKKAKIENLKIKWFLKDITDTGLKSETFDFINDRGCFHHINENERQQYADEMCRLLKPGGRLLIRGSRDEKSAEKGFVIVNQECIDRFFNKIFFKRGHVLPIPYISDTGLLDANIVILTKTQTN